MNFKAKYGSHIPVLVKLLGMTAGSALEMGGGWCSTPIFHWLCVPKKRYVLTLENDPACYKIIRQYEGQTHEVRFVTNWDAEQIECEWDVVLIDHAPSERRKEDIKRLANWAKYIVVHDTYWKQEKHYHYKEIYPLFQYRYDYIAAPPHTTILSNFVNLEGIEI